MRRCGDVQLAGLGEPQGREAGFTRPVVVVTAQLVLDQHPSVVHVVPLTSTIRGYRSEVTVEPDPGNGLEAVWRRSASTSARSPSSVSLHRSAPSVRRRSPRCVRSSPTSSTSDRLPDSRDRHHASAGVRRQDAGGWPGSRPGEPFVKVFPSRVKRAAGLVAWAILEDRRP
jgi:mRNA interferase MazF